MGRRLLRDPPIPGGSRAHASARCRSGSSGLAIKRAGLPEKQMAPSLGRTGLVGGTCPVLVVGSTGSFWCDALRIRGASLQRFVDFELRRRDTLQPFPRARCRRMCLIPRASDKANRSAPRCGPTPARGQPVAPHLVRAATRGTKPGIAMPTPATGAREKSPRASRGRPTLFHERTSVPRLPQR
jgi:hypothetical protein